MKKLYKMLCTMLALGAATSASAYTVTVNVDDASHVQCLKILGYDDDWNELYEEVSLVDGDNYFELDGWCGDYEFYPTEGYGFKSITSTNAYDYVYYGTNYWFAYFSTEATYTIVTFDAEAARTARATIIIDDVSNVSVQRDYYTVFSDIESGVPYTFKFNPETEYTLVVSQKSGYDGFYKVLVNGVEKSHWYGQYELYIQDGDLIEVITKYPAEPATLTFTYGDGAFGCITEVCLNGEPVEDFDGYTINAVTGDIITFKRNPYYTVTAFYVNGTRNYTFSSSYSATVKADTEFKFEGYYDDPVKTIHVTINDIEHVSAYIRSYNSDTYTYDTTPLELTVGENTFTAEKGNYFCMAVDEDWAMSIIDLDTGDKVSYYDNLWSQYIYNNESFYDVNVYNLAEARTAKAIITVYNASLVRVRRSDYTFITLEDGENEYMFDPNSESETQLTVYPTSYSIPLTSVTLNGELLSPTYTGSTYYYINVADGDNLDIVAYIPDKDVTATFNCDEVGAKSITVSIDGVEVEDFDGSDITMKAGQQIVLKLNSGYVMDSFYVNGAYSTPLGSNAWTTSYSIYVINDITFDITAHEVEKKAITVIVDNPDNIVIGVGGYYIDSSDVVTGLVAGKNTVLVPENNMRICWEAADGAEIISVDNNGTAVNLKYYSYVTVTEGATVTFTTGKVVHGKKTAVIWVDDITAADSYFSFGSYYYGDTTEVEPTTGYTEFEFCDEMFPMSLYWYGSGATVNKVYINGEFLSPNYAGSNAHTIKNLEDGDVIKVFLCTEPTEYAVSFEVEEGVEVNATVDHIVAVEDLTEELTVFGGTEVALTVEAAEGVEVVVKNGDEIVEADEAGNYVVIVEGATAISVSKAVAEVIPGELTVTLSAETVTLREGETATLTATIVKDEYITVEAEVWTSSDEAVATVAEDGTVTAVAAGDAIITVTVTDNYERSFEAACHVVVSESVGLKAIDVDDAYDTVIYDLQGRRVNKAAKGFYIINGVKTFVK